MQVEPAHYGSDAHTARAQASRVAIARWTQMRMIHLLACVVQVSIVRIPLPKLTRSQTRVVGKGTSLLPTKQPSRTKRFKASYQRIPTPSSTPVSVRRNSSARQSIAALTPLLPRRSKRQVVVPGSHESTASTNDGEDGVRMKLRPRNCSLLYAS